MKYLDPSSDIRFKEGLMWHGSTKPKRMIRAAAILQTIFITLNIVLATLVVILHMSSHALGQELESVRQQSAIHKQSSDRWLKQLVTCINGGTLYDKSSKTALFCSKPVEVKL